MRKIEKIILHCSATVEGKDYAVSDIDLWHKQRGYKEVGYHYIIYRDGSVNPGRDISKIGAHCAGQNKNSIGICYIGGLDENGKAKDTRTDEQKTTLKSFIVELLEQFPHATVHGHNEFANKSCPCFDVQKEFG